jgi:hypothetical protein
MYRRTRPVSERLNPSPCRYQSCSWTLCVAYSRELFVIPLHPCNHLVSQLQEREIRQGTSCLVPIDCMIGVYHKPMMRLCMLDYIYHNHAPYTKIFELVIASMLPKKGRTLGRLSYLPAGSCHKARSCYTLSFM